MLFVDNDGGSNALETVSVDALVCAGWKKKIGDPFRLDFDIGP